MYEMESQEIDEYWDREDDFVRESGIYTKEEIEQILDDHNEMRRSQQEDARDEFEMEMDSLQFDRDQLEFDREMAEMERDIILRERAPQMYSYPNPPRKSSFVKNTITAAAIFHFLKKLF